jgi:hypothetical protein
MNVRHKIYTLAMSACTILGSCGGKTNVPQKAVQTLSEDPKLTTILTDTFSTKISDKNKIIEFNKLLKKYKNQTDNYIIIDKKNCSATVYNADGDALYTSEVALGKNIGDKRAGGYKNSKQELNAYTTPGEFEITREGCNPNSSDYKLYGDRVLVISGDHTRKESLKKQTLALHRVPKSPMGKLRENVFNNGTIKDNRVSFGCVNFLEKSYDKIRNLIKGLKTKVYILPEEKGNSLHLEKQKDGNYKFFQTKYRYEYQENRK